MLRGGDPARKSGRARVRGAVAACVVSLAAGGCALIAGVPDVELATTVADATVDTLAPVPDRDTSVADAASDTAIPLDATIDAGPRCRFEDAFERDVVEIGSLNVRGMCQSVHFTSDEKLAAVTSFVNGLGATPETSWALFTLARSAPGTYDGQIQQMVGASVALRDDGLALVVSPDTEGKGVLKEYGRPRLDGVFSATGDVTSLASFDTKRNPIFAGPDTVYLDAKRTPTTASQVFRLTRTAGKLESPQGIDGLPAGAETPVPTRDGEALYFSTCNPDAGPRCAPFRSKRTTPGGLVYGSVEPMAELGDFRPRWISVDGCRLYGTRANRPAVATKLPR